MDIRQYGNIYDTSALLVDGGHDETWHKVVHASDQIVTYEDYPSVKDGEQLDWKHKIKRTRQAIQLTVAGNAVSCEAALRDKGYDAHAIAPTTVMVVLPEAKET